jgi:hypothetical protein
MKEYQISNIHTIAILAGIDQEGKGLGFLYAKDEIVKGEL